VGQILLQKESRGFPLDSLRGTLRANSVSELLRVVWSTRDDRRPGSLPSGCCGMTLVAQLSPLALWSFQTIPKRRKEQGQTKANADRVVNVRTGFRTKPDLIQQINIPSCVVVKSDESDAR
jgi:hypothetical protein